MIYICISARNEERTAGILLWKIRRVMSEFKRDYEVLFSDDASTDRTFDFVAPYEQVLPLVLFRHKERLGHGASLEELLRQAVARCAYPRRDVIVTLQADFTDEPGAIPQLVKRIEGGADLVIAAQGTDGRSTPRSIRWLRRGLPWLERKYEFPEISDPISGLRAYRVSVIKRALAERSGEPLVHGDGWTANLELLLAVAPHARRIEETEGRARYDMRLRPSRQSVWRVARDFVAMLRRS